MECCANTLFSRLLLAFCGIRAKKSNVTIERYTCHERYTCLEEKKIIPTFSWSINPTPLYWKATNKNETNAEFSSYLFATRELLQTRERKLKNEYFWYSTVKCMVQRRDFRAKVWMSKCKSEIFFFFVYSVDFNVAKRQQDKQFMRATESKLRRRQQRSEDLVVFMTIFLSSLQ